MTSILLYFLKVSLALGLVFLFYQLLLRRLTFYNWNRIYLLLYTALAFLIPFMDITAWLNEGDAAGSSVIRMIPALGMNTVQAPDCVPEQRFGGYDWWIGLIFLLGVTIFLLRFAIQIVSLWRIRRKAIRIEGSNLKLYEVDKHIIPFSFGNSVFVNPQLHTTEELKEIIRHEFIHVKQLHTVDIIWSEICCILNWYNPFAWMLRHAVRQNLEFIADNKVIEGGLDRKQYQYLLLKVIGNNHFSIANNFNFSSLKKRIAMMNKIRTARIQLARFLFILPLVALLLVAFRQRGEQPPPDKNESTVSIAAQDKAEKEWNAAPVSEADVPARTSKLEQSSPTSVFDTTRKLNKKGYYIDIVDNNGTCTVVVQNKAGKELKRMLLTDWLKDESKYESLYGEIPSPPPPVPPVPPAAPTGLTLAEAPAPPATVPTLTLVPSRADVPEPPVPPAVTPMPDGVTSIHVSNNKVEVTLKDGTKETYDLNIPSEKAGFEKKYGKLPDPPKPPAKPGTTTRTLS